METGTSKEDEIDLFDQYCSNPTHNSGDRFLSKADVTRFVYDLYSSAINQVEATAKHRCRDLSETSSSPFPTVLPPTPPSSMSTSPSSPSSLSPFPSPSSMSRNIPRRDIQQLLIRHKRPSGAIFPPKGCNSHDGEANNNIDDVSIADVDIVKIQDDGDDPRKMLSYTARARDALTDRRGKRVIKETTFDILRFARRQPREGRIWKNKLTRAEFHDALARINIQDPVLHHQYHHHHHHHHHPQQHSQSQSQSQSQSPQGERVYPRHDYNTTSTNIDRNNDRHPSANNMQYPRYHWRVPHFRPLSSLDINIDRLAEPYIREKVFLAGATAGLCSRVLGSPLSRIQILLMTETMKAHSPDATSLDHLRAKRSQINGALKQARRVWLTQGLRGFAVGLLPDILRSVPFSGINFMTYEMYKSKLLQRDRFDTNTPRSGVWARAVAGGCSGITALVFTHPLDLIRTRLVIQSPLFPQYRNILHATRNILYKEGVTALYAGVLASSLRTFPQVSINYSVFETARNHLWQQYKLKGFWTSVACGGLAGFLASTATFPLHIVAKRLHIDGSEGRPRVYRGIWDCGRRIVIHDGFKGLYSGLSIHLLKTIPVVAVSFGVYDAVKKSLGLEIY